MVRPAEANLELSRACASAHALAMQLLRNRDDAADAVQDSVVAYLHKPERYDAQRGPFQPWFLRVVRNRCVDLLRARSRFAGEPQDLPSRGAAPDAAMEEQQSSARVRCALSRLPQAQREIVVLRDYLGLPYAEIAVVLDCAAGTVMSRLHRARLALKEEFEHVSN